MAKTKRKAPEMKDKDNRVSVVVKLAPEQHKQLVAFATERGVRIAALLRICALDAARAERRGAQS